MTLALSWMIALFVGGGLGFGIAVLMVAAGRYDDAKNEKEE